MGMPIMIHMENVTAVVIGGGKVGARRARQIVDAGGNVSIISPSLHESLSSLVRLAAVSWQQRKAVASETFLADLVFLCTDDPKLHASLQQHRAPRQLMYSADHAASGNFHVPAEIQRGALKISISGDGASPIYTKQLKEKIEEAIPASAADDLEFLAKARQLILADPTLYQHRRVLLERLTDHEFLIAPDRGTRLDGLLQHFRES